MEQEPKIEQKEVTVEELREKFRQFAEIYETGFRDQTPSLQEREDRQDRLFDELKELFDKIK